MKIHEWSVVRTPDKKGLALKKMTADAHEYEVCVSVRDGKLEVSIHRDGVFEPVSELNLSIYNTYTYIPPTLKFKPPRSLKVAKKLKGEQK